MHMFLFFIFFIQYSTNTENMNVLKYDIICSIMQFRFQLPVQVSHL